MRLKTSVTLSREALRAVDRIAGRGGNRSRVIELAIKEYALRRAREARDERDAEIIRANAAYYEREALDVLEYQARP